MLPVGRVFHLQAREAEDHPVVPVQLSSDPSSLQRVQRRQKDRAALLRGQGLCNWCSLAAAESRPLMCDDCAANYEAFLANEDEITARHTEYRRRRKQLKAERYG